MTDWLLRLRHPGQRGSFLLSRGTIGPEELWHREKIDGYYYSLHTMKKRVGGMSTLVLNYVFYPGAEKGKITSQD